MTHVCFYVWLLLTQTFISIVYKGCIFCLTDYFNIAFDGVGNCPIIYVLFW